MSEEIKNPTAAKKVEEYDKNGNLIKTYSSILQAYRYASLSSASIRKSLSGGKLRCGTRFIAYDVPKSKKKHKLHNRPLKIRFDGEKYSIIYPRGFVINNGHKYLKSYIEQYETEKDSFRACSDYFKQIKDN